MTRVPLWPAGPLADLAIPNGLFTDGDWIESKDQDPSGSVRLVQLADIGVGEFLNRSDRWITDATARRLKCTFLEPHDVLIARMPDPVGRACEMPDLGYQCVTAVDVSILRVSDDVSRPWLVEAINSDSFRKEVSARIGGTTRTHISRGNLGAITLRVPPRWAQEVCGRVARTLVAPAQLAERLITAKREQKRALMRELLTGKRRFPEFTGSPVRPAALGEIATAVAARNRGTLDDTHVMGVLKNAGMVPMRDHVRAADLTRYQIVPPDGFAYNPMRLNIGSIARNRSGADCLVSPDYVVFTTDPAALLPGFLDQVRGSELWSDFVRPAGSGSVRVRIYFRDLAEIRIPLPSIAEQRRITDTLEAADREIAVLEKLRDFYKAQKRSLMHRLLCGDLTLPEPVLAHV